MTEPKLIIIAAVAIDGTIGINNEIPWHISEDFKHFRKTTMGNVILVGFNTYLTLPEKAIEGRNYIVLIGDNLIDDKIKRSNVTFVETTFDVFELLYSTDIEKVFVAGGEMIYNTMINYCDEAIITVVNKIFPEGNKKFPIEKLVNDFKIISNQEWLNDESEEWLMSKIGIEYKIVHYKRKKIIENENSKIN
jgi:dihydrofolate reductase